jgi:plastocyanin
MVHITSFIAAASIFSLASALPRPDSALGEEAAVSAPNGTPITDTAELASQTGSVAVTMTQSTASAQVTGSSSDSGSSWNPPAVGTTTTAASNSYSTPSYGSGSSNWGGSGYNDCVNQCMASYAPPMGSYSPPAVVSDSSGSSGSGATHTVIVAPMQGVLRYIPFALNASVGDTVMFMWGANNHTVTKSDSLTVCDKATTGLFTSGTQNKDFTFTQVVNDTNPVFFHCGTPGHCQQGMFGIINPPNALNSPMSVSGMMPSLSANSSVTSACSGYTSNMTTNNVAASKWGGSIDMNQLPEWSHQYVAQNVLYTRAFLASNTDVMKGDGSIDLSVAKTNPLMFPNDMANTMNNAAAPPTSSSTDSSSTSASASDSVPPSGSPSASAPAGNGAATVTSSKAIAFVAVVAAFLVL